VCSVQGMLPEAIFIFIVTTVLKGILDIEPSQNSEACSL